MKRMVFFIFLLIMSLNAFADNAGDNIGRALGIAIVNAEREMSNNATATAISDIKLRLLEGEDPAAIYPSLLRELKKQNKAYKGLFVSSIATVIVGGGLFLGDIFPLMDGISDGDKGKENLGIALMSTGGGLMGVALTLNFVGDFHTGVKEKYLETQISSLSV